MRRWRFMLYRKSSHKMTYTCNNKETIPENTLFPKYYRYIIKICQQNKGHKPNTLKHLKKKNKKFKTQFSLQH